MRYSEVSGLSDSEVIMSLRSRTEELEHVCGGERDVRDVLRWKNLQNIQAEIFSRQVFFIVPLVFPRFALGPTL